MKHILFKVIITIWRIIPLKKIMANLIKKSNFFTEKLYKDLRYVGVMPIQLQNKKFLLNNPGYTTIENEIFWKGLNSWEKTSVSLWQYLSLKSNTILDIGANTGLFSLIAATVNKTAEIYTFEPVLRTSILLKKNLELNDFENIHFFQKAVSNKTGKAVFYDVTSESQYSSSLNKEMLDGISDTVEYEVDVIALDELNELKDKKVDLIKLDVEMHEPEAIEGMIKIVHKDIPVFIIEILNAEIGLKIEKLIQDLNYEFYVIDETIGLKKTKTLGDGKNQNFLLYPKSKEISLISNFIR